MAISITASAADRVKQFLSQESGLGLRFGVKKSGCSGWAYHIEIAKESSAEDLVFSDHGVDVYVDPQSMAYIDGTVIDYTKVGLGESFQFKNPNVTAECGCGESFATTE